MNDIPTTPSPVPASEPRQGLSIASLVLGILSLLACFALSGIPAVITGHIARSRARRAPQMYGGAGMALAGLILGYVGIAWTVIAIPIAAALTLPALAKAKSRAQSVQCVSNLKQICLAARTWSNNHNETFPADFLTMSNELNSPKILVCPGDSAKVSAGNWAEFDPTQNVSYEYLEPGLKENDPATPQTVVFRCPVHGNMGLGDGSVQQPRRR